MKDLLATLGTNLHIVVVSVLLMALGLGALGGVVPKTNNGSRGRSALNLSTTAPPQTQSDANITTIGPSSMAIPAAAAPRAHLPTAWETRYR